MISMSDFLALLPWFILTEVIGLLIGWWLWGSRKRAHQKLKRQHLELQDRFEKEKQEWSDAHLAERRGSASVLAEMKELQDATRQQEEVMRQTREIEARHQELMLQQQESQAAPEPARPVSRPCDGSDPADMDALRQERDQLKRKLKMFNAFGSMEDDLRARIEALKEENTVLFRMLEDFEAERLAQRETTSQT